MPATMTVGQSSPDAKMTDNSPGDDCVGSALVHLIGKWSQEGYDEMDAVLKELDVIDEDVWN